jgi:hypothetical protein
MATVTLFRYTAVNVFNFLKDLMDQNGGRWKKALSRIWIEEDGRVREADFDG